MNGQFVTTRDDNRPDGYVRSTGVRTQFVN
ncbi:hypothetical protein FHR34_007455 [Kitasatospora kifunensis]|uniref:Uncharacterized protein n=1 Tax=Kitasatospora kifunensis TaxID=58351 RepID=A0A7W7RAZ3_KITKI|nr:hypothetical protein [Kitasatospora kifunensis]